MRSTLVLGAHITPSDYVGGLVIVSGLACCVAAQVLARAKDSGAAGDEAREGLIVEARADA